MSSTSDRTLNRIAALGLLVGAAFGLAGTLVASPHVQASLWAIDSVALVVATSLLALKYFRAGADVVAAGFLVFAIGEGALLSGTAAGPRASVPPLAAGLGSRRRLPVCSYGGADLRGRGVVAHFIPAAFPRLPASRRDLARLELDAA